MTFVLFIYIIGCILALVSFARIQRVLVMKWTLKDVLLLVFVTLSSWLTLLSLAIVAIKVYFEEMEENDE